MKKFHTHFSFLYVLFYMAVTSLFLILIYKILENNILKGNFENHILQIIVVLSVLFLTGLRFIRSDLIINQNMLKINKGIYNAKYPIEKISEIKTLHSLNESRNEILTLILFFHEKKNPIILSLEDPIGFLEEIMKYNNHVKMNKELMSLLGCIKK